MYERGKACDKDGDCTTYKGSKCNNHLCVFKGKPPVPGGGENKMCRGNTGMTDPGRKAVLDAHNKLRSQLARGEVRNGKNPNNKNLPTASYMPRMIYDCAAETAAMDYASTCALTKSPTTKRKGYGENVFVYNVPNAVPANAFKAAAKKWWDQIFLDGINWEVVFKQSLRDKPIDQKGFTQMAWAKSVKIGCGIRTCGIKSFVVCRYSPA
ncbi:SCP-like protein [Ancylostoma duodenale]|uniref:SCP-like protein n=1 Tax=Ancylostoma duodenale TaxID=51022 RepID=A0A0C2DH52_9BILA|nr:SCP-like protein [Ancylostoma duodenale]